MFSRQLVKLIQLRYSGNVTEFSRKIGKRESVVRNWLKGAQPGLADVVRLSQIERVPLAWFATGFGPTPAPATTDDSSVADRLRVARGTFDPESFARLADIPLDTLEAIEAGLASPDAAVLERLAARVNVHWLLTGIGSPNAPGPGLGPVATAEAEKALAYIIANENDEFSDRLRAAAAEEIHRILQRRLPPEDDLHDVSAAMEKAGIASINEKK